MARYEVFVYCDCGDVHPMGMSVELNDGPVDKQSVGDTYKGKEIPPELLDLHNNSVICPKTGKLFYQRDDFLVFLVPTAD
jgi:hypothetical protein